MIKTEIYGLADLGKSFNRLPRAIKDGLVRAVRKSALAVEQKSKPVTPVDTGALRRSIRSDIKPLIATISPHTEYAIYVHEGTHRMKARPFMDIGLKGAMSTIDRVFSEEIDKALKI